VLRGVRSGLVATAAGTTALAFILAAPIAVASADPGGSRAPIAQLTVVAGSVDVPAPLAGTRVVTVPVTISAPAPRTLRVDYSVESGMPRPGERDVTTGSGTLTFRRGTTEAAAEIVVHPDDVEPTTTCWADVTVPCQTFSLKLHTVDGDVVAPSTPLDGATMWVTGAADTIAAGDALVPAAPGRTVLDIPVTLASPATHTVTVRYQLASGSAKAGVEFVSSAGTLRFPAGRTVAEVAVRVLPAGTLPDEVLYVDLSAASGAVIARPRGWGIIARRSAGVPSPLARSYRAATLTQVESRTGASGDTYAVAATSGGSTISTSQVVRRPDDRMVFWPSSESPEADEESCATWSSQTPSESPLVHIQEGLVLRAATEDGVTRAITVTRNVYANAFWVFNVHVWNTVNPAPFDLIDQVSLATYFETNGGDAVPIDVCARVVGDALQFEVWRVGDRPPAWGTSVGANAQGGTVALPAGWDYPGEAGWYVGHLPADADAVYTDEYTGPPQPAP
jgi:Calx-beta domain